MFQNGTPSAVLDFRNDFFSLICLSFKSQPLVQIETYYVSEVCHLEGRGSQIVNPGTIYPALHGPLSNSDKGLQHLGVVLQHAP